MSILNWRFTLWQHATWDECDATRSFFELNLHSCVFSSLLAVGHLDTQRVGYVFHRDLIWALCLPCQPRMGGVVEDQEPLCPTTGLHMCRRSETSLRSTTIWECGRYARNGVQRERKKLWGVEEKDNRKKKRTQNQDRGENSQTEIWFDGRAERKKSN